MQSERPSAASAPVVLHAEGLTLSFLKVRGFLELLLSLSWIVGILRRLPFLGRPLETWLERKVVLSEITVSVREGSIHGIFGMNAAGKTCLLNCFANLLVPESGRILVHGIDISKCKQFARSIVSKCTRRELYNEFTAQENIEFTARLHNLDRGMAWIAAQRLLDRLGVSREEQENTFVGRLSLGTQGKVALVRSLIPLFVERGADEHGMILLLDEPTYGFDVGSVEEFFNALLALKAELPKLTIILATNDPREAAFCDAFTALVHNQAIEAPERLEHLRTSMRHAKNALREFAAIIGQNLEPVVTAASSFGDIPRIPRTAGNTAPGAFWWRELRDLRHAPVVAMLLVLMLAIPNLIGLFASAATPGANIWQSVVMTGLGIYITLIMREMMRFLDRERGVYNMLELVLASPVSTAEHFISTMSCGLAIKTIQSMLTILCIGLLLHSSIHEGLMHTLQSMSWDAAAGLLAMFAALTIFLIAVGLGLSLAPFMTRSDHAYMYLSMVPTLIVLCGGIYYQPSRLPGGAWLVELNPVTYAAFACRHFCSLGGNEHLHTVDWFRTLVPSISEGWASVLLLLFMAVTALLVNIILFRYGKTVLHRIGRLRST